MCVCLYVCVCVCVYIYIYIYMYMYMYVYVYRWGGSLMDWPLCFLSAHVGKQLLSAFNPKKQQTRHSPVALALLYFHQPERNTGSIAAAEP